MKNTSPFGRTRTATLFCLHLVSVMASADANSMLLTFDNPSGTILDGMGQGSGFTARLPGTGDSLANFDSRLSLDAPAGVLAITTSDSPENFNGQEGLDQIEAIGVWLSTLGFSGAEDFSVSAAFLSLPNVGPTDQAGVFVGSSSTNLTRLGHNTFDEPERFSTNTTGEFDVEGHFFGAGFDGADGMVVTIARSLGEWTFLIDGVEWLPNQLPDGSGDPAPPTFLDGLSDLVVGVFAINSYDNASATYLLDAFSVTVGSAGIPADFDDDGFVTGSDLERWIVGFGLGGSPSKTQGNANGDDFVDGEDFLIWQEAFDGADAMSSSVQAVPELPSAQLFVIATAASAMFRRFWNGRVWFRCTPQCGRCGLTAEPLRASA